jgi:excisionase family DNA binding protein
MPASKTRKGVKIWPEVMTLAEAAAYLRIDEKALRELAGNQEIPGRKIGSEWRFSRGALLDWLRRAAPANGTTREELLGLLRGISAGQPEKRPKKTNKELLLELAGKWKDDPTIDEMLREIYRQRGRPMTEENE